MRHNLPVVDIPKSIREFLMTRRAKVTPEQVGLAPGNRRRVAGLRREEVATLAGVSVEYYVEIERGRLTTPSDEVLHAIARALMLSEAETDHLFNLVRAASRTGRRRRTPPGSRVPAGVQNLLDSMAGVAAIVQNGRLDLLAGNDLGLALFAALTDSPGQQPNLARYVFLDRAAPEFFLDWDEMADQTAGFLQLEAGRSPHDTRLINLVGELATRSKEFQIRWATRDVRVHHAGTKRLHHPVVGDLSLAYEGLQITSAPGLQLFGYTADRDDLASRDRMLMLASWAATQRVTADEQV